MSTNVPNKDGELVVTGLEAEVDRFRLEYQYQAMKAKEIDKTKAHLREEAKRIMASAAPGVQRVAFIGTKGTGAVLISAVDIESRTNRTLLSGTVLDQAKNLGLDLEGQGLVKKSTSYVLTGAWAEYIENVVLTQMTEPYPEGLARKDETRLTPQGIERLKQAVNDENGGTFSQAAKLVLDNGIKNGTVNVR